MKKKSLNDKNLIILMNFLDLLNPADFDIASDENCVEMYCFKLFKGLFEKPNIGDAGDFFEEITGIRENSDEWIWVCDTHWAEIDNTPSGAAARIYDLLKGRESFYKNKDWDFIFKGLIKENNNV